MKLFSEVSPALWTFGRPLPPSQNRRGVPILNTRNEHPEVKLCENDLPLRCPFNPSNYEKDSKTRLSCVLVLDAPQIAWMNEAEAWLLAAVTERSQEFLNWNAEETLQHFRSAVKFVDKYGTTQMSVKLNTTGRFRCVFWSPDLKELEEMPPLEDCYVVPIVRLRGIWQQPGTRMWGASWDMTHCMTQRRVQSCPFADAEMLTEE